MQHKRTSLCVFIRLSLKNSEYVSTTGSTVCTGTRVPVSRYYSSTGTLIFLSRAKQEYFKFFSINSKILTV